MPLPPACAYCHRLKREDQLVEAHSGKKICFDCCDEFHMCEVCGSTVKEDYLPSGQHHYEDDCFK